MRDAYDAIAPEYAEKFGGDLERLELDRALLDFLTATAAGGLVLDVGCGPAQAGGYLVARRGRVLGTPSDPNTRPAHDQPVTQRSHEQRPL